MKFDFKIIGFVFLMWMIIGLGVVAVRPSPVNFAEVVVSDSEGYEKNLPPGLSLSITDKGLLFLIHNCDISVLRDKFFMHVYPKNIWGGTGEIFTNRDFDMVSELSRAADSESGKQCVIERAFGSSRPGRVVVGQFTGNVTSCCDITWSRTFINNN